LWGRTPARGDDSERFCGSIKMFRPDGSFMSHDQCPMAWVVSGRMSEVNDEEVIVERPDGSRVTAVVNIRPLKNERGEVTGAINCAYDITERKHAEDHQRFLMDELAHRGGNLLAVIQSIASRSLAGTKPLVEERNTLMRRLQALARSQSALMSKGFQGALLAEIVRLEFEAFSDRVMAKGPDVMLNSRAAQTFALLLHELATNATKYGALSLPDKGQVYIHWSIDGVAAEARFKFQWQERDGPPVVVPTRTGFGSLLLERLASEDFGAHPKITFAPGGLSYSIDASLPTMTAGNERTNLLRSRDYSRS
jgi:two-component sensor histidine kinase